MDKVTYVVCIGFKGHMLQVITPIVNVLKKEYPEQNLTIYNSKFPQYDFLLCAFTEDKDHAHKVGMALVRKHLPAEYNLCYWVKRRKALMQVVTRKEDLER